MYKITDKMKKRKVLLEKNKKIMKLLFRIMIINRKESHLMVDILLRALIEMIVSIIYGR